MSNLHKGEKIISGLSSLLNGSNLNDKNIAHLRLMTRANDKLSKNSLGCAKAKYAQCQCLKEKAKMSSDDFSDLLG